MWIARAGFGNVWKGTVERLDAVMWQKKEALDQAGVDQPRHHQGSNSEVSGGAKGGHHR